MFYKKYLNAKGIEKRKKKFGFPNSKLIELLIYDYEIFRHLLKISNKFYLKGGAAAQLYMTLPEQRASKDIDLVTDHTPEEIEEIFTKKLNKIFPTKKHIPANVTHNLPMITYLVEADSVTEEGEKIEVKVDIIFEDINNYKLTNAPASEIFALNTEVDLPAISLGCLVADKLLALAHKSIGLPSEKISEYPKQVYDLARIVRKLDKQAFADMLFSFDKIIKTELKIRGLEDTPEDIISHIFEILEHFANLNASNFRRYVNDFQGAYVNKKARRTNVGWILDSLVLIYLVKILKELIIGGEDLKKVHVKWESLKKELDNIAKLKIEDKRKLREKLLNELREKNSNWKQLKTASEEILFLELKKLEGEKIITLTDKIALRYLEKIEKFDRIKSLRPEDRPKLKEIMKKAITEKLSPEQILLDIRKSMPYIIPYRAKFIANTELSKIQNLAILENLKEKREKWCYVESSDEIGMCEYCKRLIDGRVFNVKILQDNVYANYVTKYPQYPSVPLHPNCKHKVRALSSDEKKKFPEKIPEKGFPIKF